MKENLERTIDAYLADEYNDGIEMGRALYKRDAMTGLTNFLHELITSGKANQAEAISMAMKRLEKLN